MKSLVFASACGVCACLLSGCASFAITHPGGEGKTTPAAVGLGVLAGDVTYPNFNSVETQVQLTSADFTIIRTVTTEAMSTSVLGLFSEGDNGYAKLFEEARKAGADDVINIKMDTRMRRFVGGLYAEVITKMTGTAVKWNKK
jgi:uncharacterized protein YbjQ (UPF0145 family)